MRLRHWETVGAILNSRAESSSVARSCTSRVTPLAIPDPCGRSCAKWQGWSLMLVRRWPSHGTVTGCTGLSARRRRLPTKSTRSLFGSSHLSIPTTYCHRVAPPCVDQIPSATKSLSASLARNLTGYTRRARISYPLSCMIPQYERDLAAMNPATSSMKEGSRYRDRSASNSSSWRAPSVAASLRTSSSQEEPYSPPRALHSDGRNQVRKRHSFFGRSNSDASHMKRAPALHSTVSSQSREAQNPPRPGTALSETRRRKTEPLQSIRNSIFGGRKMATPPDSRGNSSPHPSRPASRSGKDSTTESTLPREHFRTEGDCEY